MKYKIEGAILFFFAIVLTAYPQDKKNSDLARQKFTLSGTIANKSNNETLIGATINIPEANISITTNSYGFYSITLPKGEYTIIISYTGFEHVEEKIALTQNTKRNFVMNESGKSLEEVMVKANRTRTNIAKPEMSTNKLSIATIKKMPAMMGEVDVLKSILQLPGVTNAQEGATGFNVRGGSVDGNLVLLVKQWCITPLTCLAFSPFSIRMSLRTLNYTRAVFRQILAAGFHPYWIFIKRKGIIKNFT